MNILLKLIFPSNKNLYVVSCRSCAGCVIQYEICLVEDFFSFFRALLLQKAYICSQPYKARIQVRDAKILSIISPFYYISHKPCPNKHILTDFSWNFSIFMQRTHNLALEDKIALPCKEVSGDLPLKLDFKLFKDKHHLCQPFNTTLSVYEWTRGGGIWIESLLPFADLDLQLQ